VKDRICGAGTDRGLPDLKDTVPRTKLGARSAEAVHRGAL
jgi:hypothetical protein